MKKKLAADVREATKALNDKIKEAHKSGLEVSMEITYTGETWPRVQQVQIKHIESREEY